MKDSLINQLNNIIEVKWAQSITRVVVLLETIRSRACSSHVHRVQTSFVLMLCQTQQWEHVFEVLFKGFTHQINIVYTQSI